TVGLARGQRSGGKLRAPDFPISDVDIDDFGVGKLLRVNCGGGDRRPHEACRGRGNAWVPDQGDLQSACGANQSRVWDRPAPGWAATTPTAPAATRAVVARLDRRKHAVAVEEIFSRCVRVPRRAPLWASVLEFHGTPPTNNFRTFVTSGGI